MSGSNTKLLIGIAILAALLAGVGAGAAIVTGLGGGSNTEKTVKTVAADTETSNADQSNEGRTVKKTIVVQSAGAATPSTTIPVTFAPWSPSDADYFYLADLPTGGGWTAPTEGYPTGGGLHRTSVRGPDGTFVIVDRTPDEVPQLGGGYDAVETVSQPYFGTATAYLFSRSEAIPECNGRPCVDYLINDGGGGGWGVLAGGPNLDAAQSIGNQVAQSVSYGD